VTARRRVVVIAGDGHEVTLLEKQPTLGGRVRTYERGGFRFDTGASWYLMPEVFDHFFELLGTSAAEQLDLVPLTPSYRVFFDGADPLDVHPDRERNQRSFESIEPGAGARLAEHLASADDAYAIALRRFLYNNFDSPLPLAHPEVLRRLPQLGRLLGQSLHGLVAGRFEDRRLRQVLGYPAVFLGSSPRRAPSMYHLMSRLDLGDAVLYPQGGFGRLIDAAVGLAEGHGARLLTDATVTSIRTSGAGSGRRRAAVDGVAYRDDAGAEHMIDADVVVGATDLHHLETRLLPEKLRTHPERRWRRRSPGLGVMLGMLGVDGALPQLPHHSLFFTEDWDRNFDAIFGSPSQVPDPASIYVCRPSATDPSVAPTGHENLFVLVPVPADPALGGGGDDGAGSPVVELTMDAAIDQIAAWAGIPDLRDRVVVRHTVGPADFETDLHAWRGSALGLEHTLRQSAMFRPRNTSSRVEGLYYAGSSTVPGVGLPMCLISAELVLKRLRGDRSSQQLLTPRSSTGAVRR
jgi:phytoene desaturase